MRRQRGIPQTAKALIPWLGFWAFFAWGWRVRNPFTHVPAYGDVLEVLWGIRWYAEALWVNGASPLFTPLLYHPAGWHTSTFAFAPILFLIALPFHATGGPAFAYNFLAVLGLVVSFAGMYRFARLFVS
ncbi:MAG: hypothetical protein RMK32_02900 [Anaerolineae bacterium]|nr:hypothetical protein [Anaerolineae bacterium]